MNTASSKRRPSEPDGRLRLAFAGSGGIARRHLLSANHLSDLFAVTAVCDTNLEAARRLGTDADAAYFPDHGTMIEKGGFDAAVICSPHFLHYPMAVDFIEAGIPVLIEKPATISLDEMRALNKLASERDVLVIAGQMRRFEAEAVWAKKWIESDPRLFGKLVSFDLQSWQNAKGYAAAVGANHWIFDKQTAGGGVVISLAIHQLDLVRFISGADFVEVMAYGGYAPPFTKGAESNASAVFKMSNGAMGTLHASYCAPRVPYCESLTLFGEHGTVTQQVEKLGEYLGPYFYATEPEGSTLAFDDHYKGFEKIQPEWSGLSADRFDNQLHHFGEVVRGRARPVNTLSENFNTIALIEAIERSIKSGHVEKVALE